MKRSILLLLASCTPATPDHHRPSGAFEPGTIAGANIADLPSSTEAEAQGCNGWDDDDDGEVDEADELTTLDDAVRAGACDGVWTCIGSAWRCRQCEARGELYELGAPCAATPGNPGTSWCTPSGDVQCRQCAPGSRQVAACDACPGVTRIDECDDSGRWLRGPCNTCDPSEQRLSDPCAAPTACEPGAEALRRCDDACTPGADDGCGSPCRGELLRCNDACSWEVIEPCSSRQRECNPDTTMTQDCDRCGMRTVRCDGCFWMRVDARCGEQGACNPGDTQPGPCLGGSCAPGHVGGVVCNDACAWEPRACKGCALDASWSTPVPCVPGYQCGERLFHYRCSAAESPFSVCETRLVLGEATLTGVDDSQCRDNECTPGATATATCTTALGNPGTRVTARCGDDCRWSAVLEPCGGACPSECDPAQAPIVRELPCGCGATYTETTSCVGGCLETTTSGTASCPACDPGDIETDNQACGGCGGVQARSRTCDSSCRWGPWSGYSSCDDRTCTPTSETRPCSDSCGNSGTQSRNCDACCNCSGWSACAPDETAPCEPGDSETESCTYCGVTRHRSCTAGCEWGPWSRECPGRTSCG